MDAKTERKARKQVNDDLTALTTYHVGIPASDIDAVLTKHGFNALQSGIYCGRDGKVHEQVGDRTWLTLTWHKMDVSCMFEVVAYVS